MNAISVTDHQAHRYVLNNSDEVQPYIKEHMDYIMHINPVRSRRKKWVADEHNKSFINWFRNQIDVQLTNSLNSISNTLSWLVHGPHTIVLFISLQYCIFLTTLSHLLLKKFC